MTDHQIMVFQCKVAFQFYSSQICMIFLSGRWPSWYDVTLYDLWCAFFSLSKQGYMYTCFVGMSTKMTLLLVAKAKQELSIMFFPCSSCQPSERMLRPGQLVLYSLLSVGGKSFLLHSYGFQFFSKLDLILFNPSFSSFSDHLDFHFMTFKWFTFLKGHPSSGPAAILSSISPFVVGVKLCVGLLF